MVSQWGKYFEGFSVLLLLFFLYPLALFCSTGLEIREECHKYFQDE